MSDRPIGLVLDTSAIAAYATTIDVGETLNEVRDNEAAFAMPVACLAEAAQIIPANVLDLLVEHEAATVVGIHSEGWRTLAAMRSLFGRLDIAAAFAAAEEHGCDILTAEPHRYTVPGDDPPIIPIG